MNGKTMAVRMIVVHMSDERDEFERAVDHSESPMIALTDSLMDIALGALREWAQLRGTSVEACLMDLAYDD